ncbi:DUF2059 domain-containing protein [Uliginosibacterium sp. H1]|uniref:DUF2059 domain-containing protein n=1 Tax=Uliginosibacterium sp. H1 TaxID=3114757 RepID=UPI002E18E004|nr:DUF2059 domain-containing protein [Uliginosibacterium sp. H1]
MRNRILGGLIALSCLAALPAHADELTEAKRADVMRLLKSSGSVSMVDGMLGAMMPLLQQQCAKCTAEQKAILQREVTAVFRENVDTPDGFLSRMVPVYAARFSHAEIRQLLAFYESPIGRKLVGEMPGMMKEGGEAGRAWGQSLEPKLRTRLQAAMPQPPAAQPPATQPAPK